MRIVHNDEVCEVSADDFWSLRMDTGFDRFIAEGDKQIWSLLSEAEEPAGADGAVAMRRHTKLNFKENPVPSWLRGALGGGSDFSFKVTAHFYPTLYDEAHPYAYSTAFPVLADAISVVGKQWALAAGPNRCRLVSRVEVSVALTGLGGSIEKLIERGVKRLQGAASEGRSTWRSAGGGRRRRYPTRRRRRSCPRPTPSRRSAAPAAAAPAASRIARRLARDRRRRRRRPAAAGGGAAFARAPPDVGGRVGQAAAGRGPSRHRRRTDARLRLRRRRVAAAADGAPPRVLSVPRHLASLSTLASPSPSGGSAGRAPRRRLRRSQRSSDEEGVALAADGLLPALRERANSLRASRKPPKPSSFARERRERRAGAEGLPVPR